MYRSCVGVKENSFLRRRRRLLLRRCNATVIAFATMNLSILYLMYASSSSSHPLTESFPCPPCPVDRMQPATIERQVFREWNSSVRCAFVTLIRQTKDETGYAGLLESSRRLRTSFALERDYEHVLFHEAGFPVQHQEYVMSMAPWIVFHDISDVWNSNEMERPPESEWNATDRNAGYKHMCRFYAFQIFQVSRRIGLDVIMRIDDDVFALKKVDYDPFRLLWESGSDYAYGSVTRESHFHTEVTFQPWVRDYCRSVVMEERCEEIDVIESMFFDNVFAATVDGFWRSREVLDFLDRVDKSQGIYVHRWGDAPIQTAAARLYRAKTRRFPLFDYVHFSTDNLIIDGEVTCLSCDGALNYFSRLTSSAHKEDGVVSVAEIVQESVATHRSTFVANVLDIGILHDWNTGTTLDDLPVFAFLQLVEKIGVLCDNVGFVNVHILLPRTCCCQLDVYRNDENAQSALLNVVYKTLEPWMNSNLARTMTMMNADNKIKKRNLDPTKQTHLSPQFAAQLKASPHLPISKNRKEHPPGAGVS